MEEEGGENGIPAPRKSQRRFIIIVTNSSCTSRSMTPLAAFVSLITGVAPFSISLETLAMSGPEERAATVSASV